MIPPLSDLLKNEEQRHHDEVCAITRFHTFMTDFYENKGCIHGKPYKLKGISIPGNVASFEGEHEDYFFDGNKKPGHDDRDLELTDSGLNGTQGL